MILEIYHDVIVGCMLIHHFLATWGFQCVEKGQDLYAHDFPVSYKSINNQVVIAMMIRKYVNRWLERLFCSGSHMLSICCQILTNTTKLAFYCSVPLIRRIVICCFVSVGKRFSAIKGTLEQVCHIMLTLSQ